MWHRNDSSEVVRLHALPMWLSVIACLAALVATRHRVGRLSMSSSEPTASRSVEEQLRLSLSIKPDGFLQNIVEYGKARMARRAVGVLQKMVAFKTFPRQEHYNAAILACENSDSYALAVSVYEEMKDLNIPRSLVTYESLTSLAEKTGHWEDCIMYLKASENEPNIRPSTDLYNHCIWAADKAGDYELALQLLYQMESLNITRNKITYAACAHACESSGAGNAALHVLDLMRQDGFTVDTPTYKAAIWSLVKQGAMAGEALRLFKEMELKEISKSDECFIGAIWACEQTGNWKQAIDLLKYMKYESMTRKIIAYDGCLTALRNGGQWEQCLDLLNWIDREPPSDNVKKSYVTYKTVIEALDMANKAELARDVYLAALRDSYFIPWVKGTRRIDIRNFSVAVSKCALNNVFSSMRSGKLNLFDLHIIVSDVDSNCEHRDAQDRKSWDDVALGDVINYFNDIDPSKKLSYVVEKFKCEDDGIEVQKIVISREDLARYLDFV